MIALPPTPAKKPEVPPIPTVVRPAAKPAPMTGANKPAESPIAREPPMVAKPIIQFQTFD
ncbi:hypothetical protein QCA50_012816 [Cerrena zonata]|uniref:Uncharacterized protein n=1 Tax=Cerrena zonata TaxID=2478898 RepID=A0AAW0FZ95_9APHY